MRAGPGTQYEVIAQVRGGSAVDVYGCLSSRSWCDVSVEGFRGWMASSRLEFLYGGYRVPVPQYYSYFSVPVVGFDYGYWDRYYTRYPWYWNWRRHYRDPQRPRDPGPSYWSQPDRPRDPPRDGAYWSRPDRPRDPPRQTGNFRPPRDGGGGFWAMPDRGGGGGGGCFRPRDGGRC
jgi:uncharacterized protein YraI